MTLITTLSLLLYKQELTEPTPHALPRPTRIKFTCYIFICDHMNPVTAPAIGYMSCESFITSGKLE